MHKVKFEDLDKDTQKEIIDNGGEASGEYYVAGISLKTYQGGSETKVGSTYGFVGLGERFFSGNRGKHENFVLDRLSKLGATPKQIQGGLNYMKKMSDISSGV